jgi:Na+(H+)/acetate symporter ActP
MIGTAISGLTFLSLPGAVRQDGWTYLQVLLGYLVGYTLVALLLLPRYYQLSRASIYEYFRHRLGPQAEKVAAITFLISRLLASSVRLYLALIVLQLFFPQVPFPVLGLLSLMLIYIYAERGGTGTIIYTDLLQTLLFLGAGGLTLLYILTPEVRATLRLPTIIDLSIESRHYFWKDFLGGVLLSFTMTGLDQDQMQKKPLYARRNFSPAYDRAVCRAFSAGEAALSFAGQCALGVCGGKWLSYTGA